MTTNLVVTLDGDVVDRLMDYRPVVCLSKGQRGDGVWLTGIPYHRQLAPQPPGAVLIDDLDRMQRQGWLGGYVWRMMGAVLAMLLRRKR